MYKVYHEDGTVTEVKTAQEVMRIVDNVTTEEKFVVLIRVPQGGKMELEEFVNFYGF